MNRFERYRGHGFKTAKKCVAKPHEITRSGLAYTPADMERMVANGIPIQSQELATRFYDGSLEMKFSDLTSDRIKDNDLNDLWEEHKSINSKKARFVKSHKRSKSE